MITCKKASQTDIPIIQNIAQITWPLTYGFILPEEQLHYMLNLMYTKKALENCFEEKQLFYLILNPSHPVGFFAISHKYNNQAVTKIHKLYLLPEAQGKGIGAASIRLIVEKALKTHSEKLILNVNRYNNALAFYEKMGFEVVAEENIAIGGNFFMNDYQMSKNI